MSKTIEQIKADLAIAIPHFRYSVEKAKKEGTPHLAIFSKTPEGGGRIIIEFDCEEFFNDLATLVGIGPQTTEDNLTAVTLMGQQFGNRLRSEGYTLEKTKIAE
jgi:hypothetical protein